LDRCSAIFCQLRSSSNPTPPLVLKITIEDLDGKRNKEVEKLIKHY
jgi:hypothetical protein